jgi:glycosyltransferase involved in cell wall biosynthesis
MKVSGFTFCRNMIKFDFPIVESIQSILPIVDEYVVNVGGSEDDTLGLIRSIRSEKIRIVESVWDDSLVKDGRIFGIQQDIALNHCTGDWAFCLQADEVVHEDDLSIIRQALEEHLNQPEVLGLVFRMLHFKGDYWSLDPWMYRKATRVIRNNRKIRSTTDCCDFQVEGSSQMIKKSPGGRMISARIFHYGWVKEPKVLREKLRFQMSRHDGDKLTASQIDERALINAQYPNYDILKEYTGTHPAVMKERLRMARRLRPRVNRWLNWKFYREVLAHGFKG